MAGALWIVMVAFGVSALLLDINSRNRWSRVIFTLAQVGFFAWAWLNYQDILGSAWLFVFLAFVFLSTLQKFVLPRRPSPQAESSPL